MPSLMTGWRKYSQALPATSDSTVRPVSRTAARISRPDVRRPVSARHAIAPYDHRSAAMIAVHTPATTKVP